ncbi:hypothetical protein [Marinilabilia salmonicolor]|jgi:hypothetical protein|uniref:hypothetical protein n=1 Tax=Marinilabilia salmonicolor TaxID=989 RepID=UPI0011C01CC2|nr:hypothetical protein [Marinilabilia salmonicolor]
MRTVFIPCMNCGKQQTNNHSFWFVCNTCGFRICLSCLNHQKGPHGGQGRKCGQCTFGFMDGPKKLK